MEFQICRARRAARENGPGHAAGSMQFQRHALPDGQGNRVEGEQHDPVVSAPV
jgi:hypothetical protein